MAVWQQWSFTTDFSSAKICSSQALVLKVLIWAASWQNQQNDCAPSEDSVWSEFSLCAQWVAQDPRFRHADSEDWSDWAHIHVVGFVMIWLI